MQLFQESFRVFLLRIQHWLELIWDRLAQDRVALELDPFPYLHPVGRADEFDDRLVSSGSAHDHALGHEISQLSGLEVGEDYDVALEHLLDGDLALEAGPDEAGLFLAQVDRLDVEALRVGVGLARQDFSHAQVALGEDVPHFVKLHFFLLGLLFWFLRLFLLFYFLFLRLLLFFLLNFLLLFLYLETLLMTMPYLNLLLFIVD